MRRGALLLLGLFAVAGCGPRDACFPVGGIVLYRGQPLAGGLIVFAPDPERGNSGPTARGFIQPDGSFEVMTDDRAGAVRGWHRITVSAPVAEPARRMFADFPQRFRSPVESGLTWEVKSPGENQMLIEIGR